MITIEAGKYYRRRDGRIVGPAKVNTCRITRATHPWKVGYCSYTERGWFFGPGEPDQLDLVETVPNPNAAPEHDASMSGSTVQDEWGPLVEHTPGPRPVHEEEFVKVAWFGGGEDGPRKAHEFRNLWEDGSIIGYRLYRLRKPATPPDTLLRDALEALKRLCSLNENHGPFGGELYQDRIERAWENAAAILERARKAGVL